MTHLIFKGIIDRNSINKENGERIFQGFGSVGIKDRQGDFIPIEEFKPIMQKLMSTDDGIPINDSHTNRRVGKIISYDFRKNDKGEDGLFLTCKIFRNQPSDDEIWQAILENRYSGLSLGGKAGEKILTCDQEGCFNVLKDISIWEFSLVDTPANPGALLTGFNKLAKGIKKDALDEWIENNWRPNTPPNPEWSQQTKEKWARKDKEELHIQDIISQHTPKYKVYVKNPGDAPQGAKVQEGERGGHYYESNQKPKEQTTEQPKSYRINYKTESGNDYIGANDDNLKQILSELGDRVINVQRLTKAYVKKSKIYVKTPSEAPEGVQIYRGPEGGKYYETEEISNRSNRKQIESQQITPKEIKEKKVRDIVSDAMYTMTREMTPDLITLLENYGKIASNKASNDEINWSHDIIKNRLPKIIKFYTDIVNSESNSSDPIDFKESHQKVVNNLENLQNNLNDAKNRQDKIINIDNFMSIAHTSGDNVVRHLWDRPSYTGDIASKYLEYLRKSYIQKAKIYVKTPSEVPQGKKLEEGERGGHYYESEQYRESIPKENNIEDLIRQSESLTKLEDIKNIANELATKISLGKVKNVVEYKDVDDAIGRYAGDTIFVEPNLELSKTIAWKPAPIGKDPILDGNYIYSKREVPQMIETTIHESLHSRFSQNSKIGHEAINALKNLNYGGDEFEGLIRLGTFYIIDNIELKNQSNDLYNVVKNWLEIPQEILKAKIYVKTPSEVPQGKKLEEGPEGGHYYQSESNVKTQNDEPHREIGSKEYLSKLKQYIESNLQTPEGRQRLQSLNYENTIYGLQLNIVDFANLMINDKDKNIRVIAIEKCDMEHLYKLINDEQPFVRLIVAERIDQNGLHIMMHNNDVDPYVNVKIAKRIDLAGLEFIIDKWENNKYNEYRAYNIAQKRFPYVRFLTPIVDNFQKTGQINLSEQAKNYISDIMKNNTNSVITIDMTDEFYNLLHNGKYSKFHLESKNDWEHSSSSDLALLLKYSIKKQFGGEIRYHDAVKNMEEKLKELFNKYPEEFVDQYVKIHKQLTRSYLDAAFPNTNEIEIYRGTTIEEIENIKSDLMNNLLKKCLVKSNSLSSWTLKNTVAESFAGFSVGNKSGIVLKTKIPKDDIWSTFLSHAYEGNEREILVIGKDRVVDLYTSELL